MGLPYIIYSLLFIPEEKFKAIRSFIISFADMDIVSTFIFIVVERDNE